MNFENTFTYNPFQFVIVDHVFTFGYAIMTSGFVYFLLTQRGAAPRYRLASTLSAVVMISAFLELLIISLRWDQSFAWNGEAYVQSEALFSNGFRYMNWSIDVPVLLLQMLIAFGVTGAAFHRGWMTFTGAGLGMIFTGYVGQFYEVERSAPFWIWGSVSTAFFLVILWLAYRTIFGNLHKLPESARGLAKSVWWLFLVSWMLYPGAYLMPAIWDSADGVVARQITYTVADITSKVFYGVLLGLIITKVSKAEGHEPAAEADVAEPRGGITGEASTTSSR